MTQQPVRRRREGGGGTSRLLFPSELKKKQQQNTPRVGAGWAAESGADRAAVGFGF